MADAFTRARKVVLGFRWTARVLLIICVGFWLWFNVASIFYWYQKEGMPSARIHIFQAVILICAFILAWKLELLGGLLCLLLAMLSFLNWGVCNLFVALLLSAPLYIMGVLFVMAWGNGRRLDKLMATGPN